jgi:hypothetical protein
MDGATTVAGVLLLLPAGFPTPGTMWSFAAGVVVFVTSKVFVASFAIAVLRAASTLACVNFSMLADMAASGSFNTYLSAENATYISHGVGVHARLCESWMSAEVQ